MPYITFGREYTQGPSVLYSHRGKETPTSATLDIENFPKNSRGEAQIPAGTFIVDVKKADGSIISRMLPQAITKEAIATNSPNIIVTRQIEKYAYVPFLQGDKLYISKPYAKLTVLDFDAPGSITLLGHTLTYTPVNAINVNEAATAFVDYFNAANSIFTNRVKFVAHEDDIYIISIDGVTSITITPDGTVIDNAASTGTPVTTALNTTAIGTVSQVLPEEDKIILSANAAIAVPPGFIIGSPYSAIRGLLETQVELRAEFPSDNHGLVSAGSVYQLRIPYWDSEILRQLPKLTVREKF